MRITAFSPAIVVLAAATASAQQQPVGPLPATTVQLPSFSIFSVRTTVSVPDSGGAYLGGINRGRDGRTTRGLGPLAGRGIGSDRNAGGVAVRAQIHDMDELDKAVLAEAAAKRGPVDPVAAKAELLTRGVGRAAEDERALHDIGPTSVAVIRAKNAAAAESRQREATELFAKADAAQAAGKASIAKIYYQMVSRRAAGELKQLADARLAAIDRKPTVSAPGQAAIAIPVTDAAGPVADAASVGDLP